MEAGTRERILAASLELAGREGIEALTTRAVAREAGVNLGLLHYYFKSKDDLVDETVARFLAELRSRFEEPSRDSLGVGEEEALVRRVVSALDFASSRPALALGLLGSLVDTLSKAARVGPGGKKQLCASPSEPLAIVAEIQRLLIEGIRPLLARRIGADETLITRRSLQLLTSLFHPLLFSPFPKLLLDIDLEDPEERSAYVRGTVGDALRPPEPPARESTRSAT